MNAPLLDLERFHAGDDAVFAQLVRFYSPRLLAYLRRYAPSQADAHDLLQDVWLRVYRKRATFAATGSFYGWLLAIARNIGIAAVRKRPVFGDGDGDGGGSDDVDSSIDAARERMWLREAVLELPDRQREVVMLRVIEGKSTAETARALGCAEGTVKAALHIAVHKLQERLREKVR